MVARKVRCCPALNANSPRSSGGISKRIELASLVSGTISATFSAWKWTLILPGRVRVGARQELHHREQMAEMLAVMATPPAEDRTLVGGGFEPGFGKHARNRGAIFVLERAWVGRDCRVDRGLQRVIDLEQLGHEAPIPVEPLRHPASALLGAVAEADRPLGRQLAVVGDFLHRLVRELAQ